MYRQITRKVPASNSSFSTCINDFLSFLKHFLSSRSSLGSRSQTINCPLGRRARGWLRCESRPCARGAAVLRPRSRVPQTPPKLPGFADRTGTDWESQLTIVCFSFLDRACTQGGQRCLPGGRTAVPSCTCTRPSALFSNSCLENHCSNCWRAPATHAYISVMPLSLDGFVSVKPEVSGARYLRGFS